MHSTIISQTTANLFFIMKYFIHTKYRYDVHIESLKYNTTKPLLLLYQTHLISLDNKHVTNAFEALWMSFTLSYVNHTSDFFFFSSTSLRFNYVQ